MKSILYLWLIVELLIFKTGFAEVEWSIRLRDGRTPLEGRVEIFIEGGWGTVMDSYWDLQDAHVVCRQLGFSTAKAALSGLSLSLQSHITRVQCQGQESSLAHCNFTTLTPDQTGHQTFAAAGVACAVEYSIQLVGHNNHHGYLEILDQGGVWRRVCSDNWNTENAMVACRQLGYQQLLNSSNAQYSSNAVAVASTDCTGDEFHLQGCTSFQFQRYNSCALEQNVFLGCVGVPIIPHALGIHNVSCSTLILSWKVPGDRGSPITVYYIRYKQTISTTWDEIKINSSSTDPIQIEARLENLLPATPYEVQVNAANEIGNSSFSEIMYAWTSPDIQPPVVHIQVLVPQHDMSSALIHWNISDQYCGKIIGYEILYYRLNSPNNESVFFPWNSSDHDQVSHIINYLKPYTKYNVQVRTVIHINGGNQRLISEFSEPQVFMTSEGAPSGSPQSFTSYLSHLYNSAKFSWSAVEERESNGLLIGYNFSCNYSSDRANATVHVNFDNATFQFELIDIVESAAYKCAIAASTSAGMGPSTAPVYFTTPDLNRPRPPFNVVYALIDPMDSDKENFLVQAMWSISECQFNFSCFEVLGYILECRSISRIGDEIRKIIWRNELDMDQNNSFGVTTFSVQPFRTYRCQMAAINGYGTGIYGSRVDVEIPQRNPMQSPMHMYASKIQANSVTINWRYNENPPVGRLVGFYISYYLQDERYPNQDGARIRENLLYEVNNLNQIDFSYVINEYLSPGVSYNVYVAAITDTIEGGGPGPQASMSVTTLRIAPSIAPNLLQNRRDTLTEPFQYTFFWEYSTEIDADYLLLGGFILYCYKNISNSTTELYSHVYFVNRGESIQEQYSVPLTQHVTCASQISFYTCDVRAFNELGEGPRSAPTLVYLHCNYESGGLQDTFLADPYVGVVLLVLVLLLIAVVCILGVMLCYYIRQNYLSQRIIAGKYDSYNAAEAYDEGYINMAPSGATAKPFTLNGRNGNLPLPPGVNLPTTGESTDDPYNHYDWIPADRNSKGDNEYDEINLQGARMLSAARARQGSNNGTQSNIEMSSVHNNEQSSEMEASQVTTVTLLASQGPISDGTTVDQNALKLNELHRAFSISPSQSTDYVEMSGATGKKMGKAERNLLERSATSLSSHSSIGGTPKRAKYNPYHYDSLTPSSAYQADGDQERKNTTTSAAINIKTDQELSSSAAVQNPLNTVNDPAGAGDGSTAEQLCNGQDEVGNDQKGDELEPSTSGQDSKDK